MVEVAIRGPLVHVELARGLEGTGFEQDDAESRGAERLGGGATAGARAHDHDVAVANLAGRRVVHVDRIAGLGVAQGDHLRVRSVNQPGFKIGACFVCFLKAGYFHLGKRKEL